MVSIATYCWVLASKVSLVRAFGFFDRILNYYSQQLSADALARKTSFVTRQPWTSSEVAINYICIATTDVSETGISQKYG